VERGVEHRVLSNVGPSLPALRDQLERGWLVERREVGQRLELGDEDVVDPCRAGMITAMDDAVEDGVDVVGVSERVVERRRFVGRPTDRRSRA
jgi:hypothetical protein